MDPWPIVQAICAVVMAAITWGLLLVARAQWFASDQQRKIMAQQHRITEQQREIMANQLSLNFELERGRLYCNDMRIVNGKLIIDFENTGRLQLETDVIEFQILANRKIPTFNDASFIDPHREGFRMFLHIGKPIRYECLSEGFRAHVPTAFVQPLFVAFRAIYTTLSERRMYTWGWIFKPGASDRMDEVTGNRYVGPGYERDEPYPAADRNHPHRSV